MKFDVVICGGGLAGLTLARQLRREVPEARVAVIEREKRPLKDACHKVGESSVELSSHYFGVVLGLGEYLRQNHFIKNGLRFYPGGGDTLKLEDRTEIGPPQLPKVPSFQLDRGRLENDLRGMNEADGVTMLEGYVAQDLDLRGEGPHRVKATPVGGGDAIELEARWVIDASGRRALIKNKLGLAEPSGHRANAAWWRVKGRVDVNDLVPATEHDWHNRDPEHIRWYSTVHFMGTGYWFWYIPLATGYTSLGIVVHDEVHPFDTIRTFEKSLEWLKKYEPQCYAHVKDMPAEDFLCLRHYSHGSKQCFSTDRWTTVGEAGVFADPFYSPGSDFIALGNSLTTELIRRDLAGEEWQARATEYDMFYRRFFDVACETYRKAAPVYGSPRAMAAKVYWDDFNYWSFVCQYFFRGVHKLPLEEHARFVEVAKGFADLNFKAQALLEAWARRAEDRPERMHIALPTIPSILANLHLDLEREMSIEETLAYMKEKLAWAEELLGEILLRATLELPRERAEELRAQLDTPSWKLTPSSARVDAEKAEGGARRRALPAIARDLERTLGRVRPHASHETTVREAIEQLR